MLEDRPAYGVELLNAGEYGQKAELPARLRLLRRRQTVVTLRLHFRFNPDLGRTPPKQVVKR